MYNYIISSNNYIISSNKYVIRNQGVREKTTIRHIYLVISLKHSIYKHTILYCVYQIQIYGVLTIYGKCIDSKSKQGGRSDSFLDNVLQ